MDDFNDPSYEEATFLTASTLLQVARTYESELTKMSLPEMRESINIVSTLVPAGNVPALILNGLSRISGRKAQSAATRRDVNALFHGVGQILDKAVYGAVFAGPAAVIWGYQNLLKLAGKDPDDSFPEGTWQFYVDYALREDTARHANETHGFDTAMRTVGVTLSPVERMTAWTLTAIKMLHDYDDILENEWRERVQTETLSKMLYEDMEANAHIPPLFRAWQAELPYALGEDAKPGETYVRYRRRKFDNFLKPYLALLNDVQRKTWRSTINAMQRSALPAYQQQMTIQAMLQPEAFGEIRAPIDPENLQVGVIYRGRYYLIPIWMEGVPTDAVALRAAIQRIVDDVPAHPAANLVGMVTVKRAQSARLRESFDVPTKQALARLRQAPILLNFDLRPADLPTGEIRQAERGIGDHALTIFDTGQTFVFDQSHIFFDGAWGAAFAEIMTNEAIVNAHLVRRMPESPTFGTMPESLRLHLSDAALARVANAAHIVPEIDVENDHADLKTLLSLRESFKQRNDLLQMTVNDILVLYRAIHAVTYQPNAELAARVRGRYGNLDALHALIAPPAILIPVDCSPRSPRDRLYPISFDVPLRELNILALHESALEMLDESRADPAVFKQFIRVQRDYFAALAGFGAVMTQAKLIAANGESASVSTIKLLANLPRSMQRMLDKIPHRFEVLNDLIKGREVFSNIGQVAPGSSLTRFIAAKDDNEKKTLAWGVLTDNRGKLHISLRDFRPHISKMIAGGDLELAKALVQDYLDSYVNGLNLYVAQVREITRAKRSGTERRRLG